jgi:hypothetical protein
MYDVEPLLEYSFKLEEHLSKMVKSLFTKRSELYVSQLRGLRLTAV